MATDRQSPGQRTRSGRGVGEDPTNMPGQYPQELFGMALPQTSGAKGSRGSLEEPESINQPGQYPQSDPISGVQFPQGTGAPGSQGREADDQAVTGAAQFQTVGSTIYGETVEDHAMHQAPSRPDGMYPPEQQTVAVKSPLATGAGQGAVRGPGHPNARQ